MRFARRVFLVSGIYGIAVLMPQYFLEDWMARHFPPAFSHPEQYYGFTGVALAWQFAFLLIARDVLRYRPMMPIAVLEKLSFALAALILFAQGRSAMPVLGAGLVDLMWGVLFVLAYRRCGPAEDGS